MPRRMSLVIPSLGREEALRNTVLDLLKQTMVDWECLVVFQGSISPTCMRALEERSEGRVHFVECNEPNASLARNIGLRKARSDTVLFLDDDIRIENRSFLENHFVHHQNDSYSGVFGQVLNPDRLVRTRRHPISRLKRTGWLYFPPNFGERCLLPAGGAGNLSVRRNWAVEVGGMDAQFEKGAHREESDFCLRYTAKYGPLVFEPAASVVHLGVSAGGCRAWGDNRGIHPLHHVTGEWYFLLKGLRNGIIFRRDLPHHLGRLWARQIWNADNRWRPRMLYKAMVRSAEGLSVAREKLRQGPKYLPK